MTDINKYAAGSVEEYPEIVQEWRRLRLRGFIEQAYRFGLEDIREQIAALMIAHGFATGHGDKSEDLLKEFDAQLTERRAQVKALEPDRARLEAVIGKGWEIRESGANAYGHTWYVGRPHYTHMGSGTTAREAIDAAIQAASQSKEPG